MAAPSVGVEPPVVALEGVSFSRGGVSVLEDITFSLEARHFLGLVGPNGAGKTTLIKCILGLATPDRGRIEVFGAPAGSGRGFKESTASIGYVPQKTTVAPSFPASVLDVVRLGGLRRPAVDRRRALDHLERVGLVDRAHTPVGQLSGGEQRRVLLAQALCASGDLLVLDEPTAGLDLPAEQAFYGLLRELKSELSCAVIAVSHDLVALAGETDRLICINRTMHVHGNPADVIHSHALQAAYSCEFDFLRGEIAHHERFGREHRGGSGDPS